MLRKYTQRLDMMESHITIGPYLRGGNLSLTKFERIVLGSYDPSTERFADLYLERCNQECEDIKLIVDMSNNVYAKPNLGELPDTAIGKFVTTTLFDNDYNDDTNTTNTTNTTAGRIFSSELDKVIPAGTFASIGPRLGYDIRMQNGYLDTEATRVVHLSDVSSSLSDTRYTRFASLRIKEETRTTIVFTIDDQKYISDDEINITYMRGDESRLRREP